MAGVTIHDVARAAGTSVSSVSAVLSENRRHNIRVSDATRERILQAARDLDYTPNPIARSLVTRKTGAVGLVFPYSRAFTERNPFFTQVMSGVFEEVIRARYDILLHTAIGDGWHDAADSVQLDPRVDGLILVLPGVESLAMRRCQRKRFPCVGMVGQPGAPDVCMVNSDDFQGGKLATKHLLDLGHRRIAHFAGTPRVTTTGPRLDGYRAALCDAGIAPDAADIVPAGFAWEHGYEAMGRILDRPAVERPTAIFAANDLCADGAMRLLREREICVPEQMSIVGYDDTWFAAMTQPALTSVHMPIEEMGVLAARMLIALMEGREVAERQPILPVSLTIRESCGPLLR